MAKRVGNKTWVGYVVAGIVVVFAVAVILMDNQSGTQFGPSKMTSAELLRAASFETLVENGEMATRDVTDSGLLEAFGKTKPYLSKRQLNELSAFSDQDVIDVLRGTPKGKSILDRATDDQLSAMEGAWESAQAEVLNNEYVSVLCGGPNPCEADDCKVYDPDTGNPIQGTCCTANGNKCEGGEVTQCAGAGNDCYVDEDYMNDEEYENAEETHHCSGDRPVCCEGEYSIGYEN